MKRTSALKNVTLLFSDGVTPSQIGSALEQDSTREKDPVVGALTVVRYESGDLQCLNSNMSNARALELAAYAQHDVMRQIMADNDQIVEYE